jgi:hypothetical protein
LPQKLKVKFDQQILVNVFVVPAQLSSVGIEDDLNESLGGHLFLNSFISFNLSLTWFKIET